MTANSTKIEEYATPETIWLEAVKKELGFYSEHELIVLQFSPLYIKN